MALGICWLNVRVCWTHLPNSSDIDFWRETECVCVYVDDSDKLCRCGHDAIDQPPRASSFELTGNCSDVEMKNNLLGRNNSNIEKKREWEMWINFGTKDIEFWSVLLLRAHSHWFIQTSSLGFQIVANCFSRQTSFHLAQRKKNTQTNKKRTSEVITVFLEEQLQFRIFTSITVFTFLKMSKLFSFFVVLGNICLLFLLLCETLMLCKGCAGREGRT